MWGRVLYLSRPTILIKYYVRKTIQRKPQNGHLSQPVVKKEKYFKINVRENKSITIEIPDARQT